VRHKKEAVTAFVCLLVIAAFVVGMRAGLHDSAVKSEAELRSLEQMYVEQINNLNLALEKERQIEHVVYEYIPLPTDYENIGIAHPSESDAVILAKTMWGEYRNAENYAQCAAVCYCALNRVAAGYGTLEQVCTTGQFHGYEASNPVDAELYRIAVDVLCREALREFGVNDNVGRVLPDGYLWMEGDGRVNTYRNAYDRKEADFITP